MTERIESRWTAGTHYHARTHSHTHTHTRTQHPLMNNRTTLPPPPPPPPCNLLTKDSPLTSSMQATSNRCEQGSFRMQSPSVYATRQIAQSTCGLRNDPDSVRSRPPTHDSPCSFTVSSAAPPTAPPPARSPVPTVAWLFSVSAVALNIRTGSAFSSSAVSPPPAAPPAAMRLARLRFLRSSRARKTMAESGVRSFSHFFRR